MGFLPGAHFAGLFNKETDSVHPPPSSGREKLVLEGSPDSHQPEVQLVWLVYLGIMMTLNEAIYGPFFFSGVLFPVNITLYFLAKVPVIDVSADDLHSASKFNPNCIAVIPKTIQCFSDD
ncbi:unnamed protein product, partial [Bubo scandiacus]